MTYRSRAHLPGASRTTAPIPVPTGAAAGDIAVVGIYQGTDVATTPPAGFAAAHVSPHFAASRFAVYWKRLTQADTGTYDFTLSAESWIEAVCALFAGRTTTGNPFTATSTHMLTPSQSVTLPGVAAANGDDLMGFGVAFYWGSWTVPPDMVERHDTATGISLATADGVAAGPTGDKTFTTTAGASGMKGFLGALSAIPAASGSILRTQSGPVTVHRKVG